MRQRLALSQVLRPRTNGWSQQHTSGTCHSVLAIVDVNRVVLRLLDNELDISMQTTPVAATAVVASIHNNHVELDPISTAWALL